MVEHLLWLSSNVRAMNQWNYPKIDNAYAK